LLKCYHRETGEPRENRWCLVESSNLLTYDWGQIITRQLHITGKQTLFTEAHIPKWQKFYLIHNNKKVRENNIVYGFITEYIKFYKNCKLV
jgi:hypothetical protein